MARKAHPPIHPGEIFLEEFLEPMELSQYRLAKDISVPPRRINEIVHGKRGITADTALRLSRYFGSKQPHELLPLDIARLKKELQNKKGIQHGRNLAIFAAQKRKDNYSVREIEKRIKKNEKTLSAQTVRHALTLLRRLCNFG